MPAAKVIISLIASTGFIQPLWCQQADSTNTSISKINAAAPKAEWQNSTLKKRFPLNTVLIPGAMIVYGLTAIENDGLKNLNAEIKEELFTEHPHKKFPLDNYLQFAPAMAVYGLNAMGINGKNNFRDRSMIWLMSNIIVNTTVFSVKELSHQLRPDGSNYFSFPSGHTAEAFASAEFLRQEYKDISPWYGIAGYAMATTTGYLRMYNNKHWLNDVVAGAGIGIASTKLAYWLYPKIQHKLFRDKPLHTVVMPTYQNKSFGLGVVHKF